MYSLMMLTMVKLKQEKKKYNLFFFQKLISKSNNIL